MEFAVTFEIGPSQISNHGSRCCADALAWIDMIDEVDHVLVDSKMPSRRFHQLFEWGPLNWPVHWCEIVSQSHIDCGGFAALYQYLFHKNGYKCARLQVVEAAQQSQIGHWREIWSSYPNADCSWLSEEGCVYHEALVVYFDSEYLFFDPTDYAELGTQLSSGGDVLSIRLCSDLFDVLPQWHGHSLVPWKWVDEFE
jgi:hypothetical protein